MITQKTYRNKDHNKEMHSTQAATRRAVLQVTNYLTMDTNVNNGAEL